MIWVDCERKGRDSAEIQWGTRGTQVNLWKKGKECAGIQRLARENKRETEIGSPFLLIRNGRGKGFAEILGFPCWKWGKCWADREMYVG